ncbi:hypothetical protein Pfo_017150 [Paulownia fortunei]|nr:hypothetical protein Pfo_017150 [Paulownia fortunei]
MLTVPGFLYLPLALQLQANFVRVKAQLSASTKLSQDSHSPHSPPLSHSKTFLCHFDTLSLHSIAASDNLLQSKSIIRNG